MAKQYAMAEDFLGAIDGVGCDSAIAIFGEIGTDMSRFPCQDYLSSLCGMSLGNNESAV